MSIAITQQDFKGVGQVATHCDLPKLEIAIDEAILFDLEPLLCNLFGLVDENWREATGIYKDIVAPKAYENCANYKTKHLGLRRVLVYFAYARYLLINPMDDTPNGAVTKQNDFSMPKPLKEIQAHSTRYKNMALTAFAKVEAYILQNKTDYPAYHTDSLLSCGCNGSCGKKLNTRGAGLRSKTIRK